MTRFAVQPLKRGGGRASRTRKEAVELYQFFIKSRKKEIKNHRLSTQTVILDLMLAYAAAFLLSIERMTSSTPIIRMMLSGRQTTQLRMKPARM